MSEKLHYPPNEGDIVREFAAESYHRSIGLLAEYSPAAVPQEPTMILFENDNAIRVGGTYYGKARGKHVVSLRLNLADKNRLADDAVLTLSHELLHQVHAEIVGQENFLGYNLERAIGYLRPEHSNFLKQVDERLPRHMPNVGRAIVEGFAVLVERFVLDSMLKQPTHLASIAKDRSHLFRKFLPMPPANFRSLRADTEYWAGVQLLKPLYDSLSPDDFIETVARIDMSDCIRTPITHILAIRHNSMYIHSDYKDPYQLPGLS